jgi:hypothetical protein
VLDSLGVSLILLSAELIESDGAVFWCAGWMSQPGKYRLDSVDHAAKWIALLRLLSADGFEQM